MPNINKFLDQLFEEKDVFDDFENFFIRYIQSYYESGGDLNCFTNRNGWQLIHMAAANGCTRAIDWLLTSGVEVNSLDQSGVPALFHAVDFDIDSVIQSGGDLTFEVSIHLINKGANINFISSSGETITSLVDVYRDKSIKRTYEELVLVHQ